MYCKNKTVFMISQPESYSRKLLKHQLVSAYSIELLEKDKMIESAVGFVDTRIGVFSDPQNSGKTTTLVSVICRNIMEWDIESPFAIETTLSSVRNLVMSRYVDRYRSINPTLVLTSDEKVDNWKNELSMTDLKYAVINSKKSSLSIESFDVVVVTPAYYNNLVRTYAKCAWKRFIYEDPVQNQVRSMCWIVAGFYWLVTPYLYELRTVSKSDKFLSNLVDKDIFTFHSMLKPLTISTSYESFYESSGFALAHSTYYYELPVYNMLNNLVGSSILRYIETDNVQEAIRILGGIHTCNIVELIRRNNQERLDQIANRLKTKPDDAFELETEQTILTQQLKDLDKRFSDRLSSVCSICLETLKSPVLEPLCQNIFCGECLLTWLKTNNGCPLCRGIVVKNSLISIDQEPKNITPSSLTPVPLTPVPLTSVPLTREIYITKLDHIINIVTSKPEAYYIISCSSQLSLINIRIALEEHGISSATEDHNVGMFNSKIFHVLVIVEGENNGYVYPMATDLILTETCNDKVLNKKLSLFGGLHRLTNSSTEGRLTNSSTEGILSTNMLSNIHIHHLIVNDK